MNIDLSEREMALLEDALFAQMIQARTEARNVAEPRKAELSKHVNELANLSHKIWRAKEGIK